MFSSLIESKQYPGFYEIQGFSNYVINKKAEIYSRKSNKFLKPSKTKRGYFFVHLYDDEGFKVSFLRHRLMAMLFIPTDKEISDLQVNHKDGVPGNDQLDNLEWCTRIENVVHAWNIGHGMGPKLPISVRNILTGTVKHYPSISSCAEALDMTYDQIEYRRNHYLADKKIYPELNQYRPFEEDEKPWYIPSKEELELFSNGNQQAVYVKNLIENKVELYKTARDAANAIGVAEGTLSSWLDDLSQPVLPGLIQVQRLKTFTTWRKVEDPYLEIDTLSRERVIVLYNPVDFTSKIFTSARKCANFLRIIPTTLNYRLSTSKGKVQKDGYIYYYYSDFIKSENNNINSPVKK